MTRRINLVLAFPWFLTACAVAPPVRPLPLTKLRLYETGVGYFERAGELGGPGGATVPVPSGHLDDAIKSLVILGERGEVESVAFDSRQSPAVARARAGLPPDTDIPIRILDVFEALRGHEVVVRYGPKRTRGRVVDLIGAPQAGGSEDAGSEENAAQAGALRNRTFLLIVTHAGTYRRIDVAMIDAVTPTEAEVRMRLEKPLDAAVTLRSNARGLMEVTGRGGELRLGYLAESPVWRATYRLVLDEAQRGALQGWALVHNDTDENWDEVVLELVNGRPDSFLFPLAAPRYDRRELEVPDRTLSSVPQLLDTTPDAMWGDFLDTGTIGYGGGGGTGSGYGRGSGSGFGGRGQRVAKVTGTRIGSSSLVQIGDLASLATGQSRETKTAFVYGTHGTIDVGAGRSAMVPFVEAELESGAVTWMIDFADQAARHAVRIVNDTPQTLPEGTLGIFADGGFAGETLLPRTKPGERHFLDIADDLDTELTVVDRDVDEVPQRVLFVDDAFIEHFVSTTTVTMDLVNRSAQPRHVHIEVTASSNSSIEGADRLDFDVDREHPLALFEVAPNATIAARKIVIVQGLSRTTSFDDITPGLLERLVVSPVVPEAERRAIELAVARLKVQTSAKVASDRVTSDIETIEKDIERLRGHVEAASGKGGEGNPGRLVDRLLELEERLDARRKDLQAANTELDARKESTRSALAELKPQS